MAAKKAQEPHPFMAGCNAVYLGENGQDIYGDMTLGKAYRVQDADWDGSSPLIHILDDCDDGRVTMAKYFAVPKPVPPTEAGAAEYEDIMAIQDLKWR